MTKGLIQSKPLCINFKVSADYEVHLASTLFNMLDVLYLIISIENLCVHACVVIKSNLDLHIWFYTFESTKLRACV